METSSAFFYKWLCVIPQQVFMSQLWWVHSAKVGNSSQKPKRELVITHIDHAATISVASKCKPFGYDCRDYPPLGPVPILGF